MHQAKQSFFISRDDGTEEFVPVGKVFADAHPFVARDADGLLFVKLEDETGKAAKPVAAVAEPVPVKKGDVK